MGRGYDNKINDEYRVSCNHKKKKNLAALVGCFGLIWPRLHGKANKMAHGQTVIRNFSLELVD